ncbi:MAG: bifunctional diguanylate cyclase/phosphodiesterase [Halopseudomonas sp.]
MIGVILLMWGFNLRELIVDHSARMEQRVGDFQQRMLSDKVDALDEVFQAVYEHARTISLLPSVRSVEGGNRKDETIDPVAQGRLSLETHQTIEQIYKNLANTISLSEIYYVLDGFDPDNGEVPFFMYDDEIVGVNDHLTSGDELDLINEDVPEEYELAEYAYYQTQLQRYRERFARRTFSGDITAIPALISPLMRTCDNTQYNSVIGGNEEDSHGLLYSLPVFDLDNRRYKGIISTVVRANVLEAVLVGVPFIPVTVADSTLASSQGWALPEKPADLLLTNSAHDIAIFDRRDPHFSQSSLAQLGQSDGRIASLPLNVVSDGQWRLYHYLSPGQVDQMTADLQRQMWLGVIARISVLLVLLAIFWRANSDQLRHHRELIQLAHYDSLTLLPNRSLLYKHLGQSIARAKRHNRRLGLMFVDIDEFGSINDTLGHKAGDAVLMAIAERLRQTVRLSDEVALRDAAESLQVARLGGDDFAIIYEDLAQAEDGVMLGERLLQRFREPVHLENQETEISLSGGMSVYPDDAKDIDELMACADYALRHAAERGAAQFQMYNDEMRQKAARQTRLMQDLPNAIRLNLFTLNYQPKQSLVDDRIVSFEALLRWHHDELGFVSPVEFIPLLEQSGYIVEVGRWVLLTACQQLKRWQRDGNPELCMSVNVSPRQLMLSDIVATVDEVLAETGVVPHTLILEITESMMIDNLDEGNQVLHELKTRGVKLAIDDFGTGYSSLTYLQELPVDYLKLDKSMIDVIGEERGAHVIRTTIVLAQGLGLVSIAEGVEELSQRELLKQMGCDLIQGYWLSRPQPAELLGKFLNSEARGRSI